MTNDKKEITIKDIITSHFTWIIAAIVAILSMYISLSLSPLSNRIDVLAKDVQYNTERIESCDDLQLIVTENSTTLGIIKDDIHDIKESLNSWK